MNSTRPKSDSHTVISSEPAPSISLQRLKQRLIICLDGTWNKRDDCTNVYHLHNLIAKGEVVDRTGARVWQRRYYDEGVGTGVLDSVTGGAFGFGLEENVREAYDWLVEQYRDGDEIYIFGFSRGAYTARSLVGFIARCGLLLHGAPLSVNQLWDGYGFLGREHEDRAGWWDNLSGHPQAPFEQITNLKFDPWHGGGTKKKNPNPTEQMLIQWSRRVPIHFLGIFDTVGAMGWDALAIPGLRSKLALHHNMRPTKLIQSCCHALAIDEHRSSFSHTPMLHYIKHNWTSQEESEERADWDARIKQRWFVGAHSNIGGGYADNVLSLEPLRWLLTCAESAHLVVDPLPVSTVPAQAAQRRDSYMEFVTSVSARLFRSKRNYRRIDPPHEVHGPSSHAGKSSDLTPETGYSLRCINEQLDPSVFTLANGDADYRPPNLIEYVRRSQTNNALAHPGPAHPWLAAHWGDRTLLVAWCTLAAAGLLALNELFCAAPETPPPLWLLPLLAGLLVLVDWSESRLNFSLALHPDGAFRQACLDSVFWLRAIGLVLVIAGAFAFIAQLLLSGWSAPDAPTGLLDTKNTLVRWWPVPLAAAVATLLADIFEKKFRPIASAAAMVVASLGLAACGTALTLAGYWAGQFVWHWSNGSINPVLTVPEPDQCAPLAGLLLLLQIALLYLGKALDWIVAPMSKANLGRLTRLQLCCTPNQVRQRLDDWRTKLTCAWEPALERDERAARNVRRIVGNALWRDTLGFVPLYAAVLALGLWMAVTQYEWTWLSWLKEIWLGKPVWFWIVAITAVADWIENGAHGIYLRRFSLSGKPNWLLVLVGLLGTGIKFIGLIAASGITAVVLAVASWDVIMTLEPLTWRAAIAGTASLIVAGGVLMAVLGALISRIRRKLAKEP